MAIGSFPTRRPQGLHHRAVAAFGIGAALSALAWILATDAGEPRLVKSPSTRATGPATESRGEAAQPRGVADLQDHLRRNPGDSESWAALGVGYVEEARLTGNPSLYPKAEGAFDKSLSLRPEGNIAALAGRGALANARHDFAAGLRFADEAIALDGANAQATAVRGDALVELGRYDDAFTAYQRAVELAPGLATYTRAAYALDLQGDVAGAARNLELALGDAFTPQDVAFANFSLGELAWNRGDLDRARQHYTRAASADPAALGPKAGLARVAAATGAVGDAIARWRDVVERGPLPEYVGELVNLYQVSGRAAEAQQQLNLLAAQRALVAANGVNGDLELALFSADHRLDLDQGLAAAQAEWERRKSIHAADALAWQLHAHGRHTEALALADQALHLGTPNALFHYHRGMIERALGDTAAARQDLSRALAINPHFSALHAPAATEALARLGRGTRR